MRAPALLALLALAGCPLKPLAVPDGAAPDGGLDAVDAGADAGPPRTATTRALLATSTRSLLLDPFVTTDASWGHFVGLLLPAVNGSYVSIAPRRDTVSQSPGGVAAPVATFVAVSAVDQGATSLQVVAPFPGGSEPFDAQIWISAGDADGNPVLFDPATGGLTVALLPNDLPSRTYPLTRDPSSPIALAGRQWVRLALPGPVPMPEGGWFSITVGDVNATFQLQAPDVSPTTAPGPHRPPLSGARAVGTGAALAGYVEILRRAPPPRSP